MTTTSSDKSTAKSIDAAHQTSIDDTPPEAGKFSLTNNANESAIKLPKDDTKKSVVSLEYLFLSPLAKIKESLDSLHSALEGQSQFGIDQIDDDTLSELEQRVDFVDNPTLKDRYHIPNPDSFTQNYDATVDSRRGRSKFRLNQAFTGNCKMATDLNEKIDMIYSELLRKFDALSKHIKRLDGQVAENATAIKREAGRLHGRTVLLRSGRHLNPSTIEINQAEKRADVEKTGENRSRPIIPDSPNPESETPRESERSNTEDPAIDFEEEEEELEDELEIDRQEGTNIDRPTAVNIVRKTESNIDRRSNPAEPAIGIVYKTLPPFPPKKMQTKRELDKAIYDPLEKVLTSSEEETFSVNSKS
ncbi:hypothetical protein F2Q69_00006584 [Brassica cretica]|uniref:Uncharacterized protein n=1 Tax=Brassica cretica TaxID=69181 RepID=A0A8S9P832_BRACR|nr:hypothetical protein F2Q69_00006584 [Brassica cretica]